MSTWHSLGSADAAKTVWASWNAIAPPLIQGLRLRVWGADYVYGQYTVNNNLHGTFQGAGYHDISPYPVYSSFPVDANCQDMTQEHGVEIQVYY